MLFLIRNCSEITIHDIIGSLTDICWYDTINIVAVIKVKADGVSIMLKILDEKEVKTDEEIEEQYKDCKYLYIIDSYDKIVDHNGYLYCISTSDDSFNELIAAREKLRSMGKLCVLGGSYNNGGAVGVQYEYKGQ